MDDKALSLPNLDRAVSNGEIEKDRPVHSDLKQKPYQIMKLEISNFKGIKFSNVDANGGHVIIKGRNEAGKSSHYDAVEWLLGRLGRGKDSPVRIGEHECAGLLKLSNGNPLEELTIQRALDTAGKQRLTLTKCGSKQGGPQGCLDLLFKGYILDPMAFVNARWQDQIDQILSLCKESPPSQVVFSITGMEYQPRQNESAIKYLDRLCADKTGLFYETRTEASREHAKKSKALEEQKERLKATLKVERPPSTADLMAQLVTIGELEKTAAETTINERRIDELEAQLAVAKARRTTLVDRNTAAISKLQPGLSTSAPDLKAQIQQYDRQRQLFEQRRNAEEDLLDLVAAVSATAKDVADADTTLKQLRKLKADFLAKCDFGVPGLDITPEGLSIGGVPLSSCSMAQRIKLAIAVCVLQRPGLGLIRIDEGERLDMRSRYQVFSLAEQYGCQVLLTAVTEDQELVIEVMQ